MEVNSGIVRDTRGGSGECPTDPDVAGIGVSSRSRGWQAPGRADNIRLSYLVWWPRS